MVTHLRPGPRPYGNALRPAAFEKDRQRSMWPVAVVMRHENIEDPIKMVVVQDQEPVETL